MIFKKGDRVKLKNYTEHSDHFDHNREWGIIAYIDKLCGTFSHQITWEDNSCSWTNLDNILRLNTWKDKYDMEK